MYLSWPRVLALLIASSWVSSLACSSAKKIDAGGACTLNSDCAKSLVCTWGKCHAACKASIDCPAGQSCVITADKSTVCQLPIEEHCTYDSECQAPLTCAVDERCHNQCQTSLDCVSGQICADTKACAEPTQLDSRGRLIPATDGGIADSADALGDGSRAPSLDGSADRTADRSGSTGPTSAPDGALGAEAATNPTPDASPDGPADDAPSVGGIGGNGGSTSTGSIVSSSGGRSGSAGVTSIAGGSRVGGASSSGGTTSTGGSRSIPADAGADLAADATNDGARVADAGVIDTRAIDTAVFDSNVQIDAPIAFITTFATSTSSISAGHGVTLSWVVGAGATYVSIDNGVGIKPLVGTVVVYPTLSTTYVLTATDGAGHFQTAQASVIVVGGAGGTGGGGAGGAGGVGGTGGTGGTTIFPRLDAGNGLPQITSFAAGGTSLGSGTYAIYTGHQALLTAAFSNATSAKIDPGFPSVDSTVPVATDVLTQTTTYTLTASNALGDSTAQITLQVFPSPVTVATAQYNVNCMAVDSSNVYWGDSGAVMKVSSAGGGAPVPIASGLGNVRGIALDADYVYWTDYSLGTVSKIAKVGGSPAVPLASNQYYAGAIAVDSSNVYWIDYSSSPPDGGMGLGSPVAGTGTIMKVGLDGNGLTPLASGLSAPSAIAIDANNVYWADYSDDIGSSIKSVAKVGGPSRNIAVGLARIYSPIGVDANGIYWATASSPGWGVARLALTGGAPNTFGDTSWNVPNESAFAMDDTNAYFSYGGNLAKVPLAGGATVILAFGQERIRRIAVDATSVYWTTDLTNLAIMKAPK